MIKLNLQLFGGRGGSGGGGGSGGTGGSSSHHGSAGGTGSGYSSQSSPKKASGQKVSAVKADESYFIAATKSGREGDAKAVKGSALLKLIRRGELVYNPNTEKWEDKKRRKYTIRRK